MLGGEPCQGLGAEVHKLVDRLLGSGQPFPELGALRLEPDDLSFTGVGDVSGLLQGLAATLELGPQRSRNYPESS
ncbi:hypothetical protein [Streptomyces sp. NPDC002785]|uniref:hypothetical protein n=1 Tax=Streptomyces sp. NPDC002785 TaxID=3154543 RepID=UPI00332D3611